MEMTTVLTKRVSAGDVVVSMYEYTAGTYLFSATLDGHPFLRGGSVRPRRVVSKPEITHVLAGAGTAIGLTADEAATLEAARQAAEDAYRATPAGQMRTLRSERERLVADVQGAVETVEARFEAAHAREDARAWTIKGQAEGLVTAARAALATFDAAHPEVRAVLADERRESAARNAWM